MGPANKTTWVYIITLFYACILGILGLIPYNYDSGTPDYGLTIYNATTTTPTGSVVQSIAEADQTQCGLLGGQFQIACYSDGIVFHAPCCILATADTRQHTHSFFGNVIGNIGELKWFNAILFAPLAGVIAWLLLSGPKVGGSGWDGGV